MNKLGFLIDMDGVICKGNQLIPGADAFISRLQREGSPFLFLTNNSQRTRRDVSTKLKRMGIDVGEEHIFTCAMATARFLSPSDARASVKCTWCSSHGQVGIAIWCSSSYLLSQPLALVSRPTSSYRAWNALSRHTFR